MRSFTGITIRVLYRERATSSSQTAVDTAHSYIVLENGELILKDVVSGEEISREKI